ncbi:MAG: DUF6691 family protein [Alphaproteobacteria bacterium]
MQTIVALIAGLLFGIGLTLGQMVDPAKVLAFLDIGAIPAGGWDPSLAFVMGGAVLVNAPFFWFVHGRGRPLAAPRLVLPANNSVDRRLLSGALLFGAGWGLGGYCPGPAIAGLTFGAMETFAFVAAMLAGMAAYKLTLERR